MRECAVEPQGRCQSIKAENHVSRNCWISSSHGTTQFGKTIFTILSYYMVPASSSPGHRDTNGPGWGEHLPWWRFVRISFSFYPCANRVLCHWRLSELCLNGIKNITNPSSTVSVLPLSFGLFWTDFVIISSYFGIASVPFQMMRRRFRAVIEKARDMFGAMAWHNSTFGESSR